MRALAREPDAGDLRRRLGGTDAREVAWALHDVALHEPRDVEDRILSLLERVRDDATPEGRRLLSSAGDAAAVLGLAVPAPLLASLEGHVSGSLLTILASTRPAEHRDLLASLLAGTKRADASWRALCNLLAPLRDHRLVRHLLALLHVRVRVVVRDLGDSTLHLGNSSRLVCGTGCAQISADPLSGWPPRVVWSLQTHSTPGARLVAPGRVPVYGVRSEIVEGSFLCRPIGGDREAAAAEYLGEMLFGDPDALRPILQRHVSYRSLGPRDDRVQRRAAEADARAAWGGLLVACLWKGLLDAGDLSGLPPRVDVEVEDLRRRSRVRGRDPPR
jgi:hypothetical protein